MTFWKAALPAFVISLPPDIIMPLALSTFHWNQWLYLSACGLIGMIVGWLTMELVWRLRYAAKRSMLHLL